MPKPSLAARISATAILASLLLFVALSVPAAADDVFEVKNIAVDVKAATAADARTQALAQGERRAFYTLIQRLTLSSDQERIPEFSRDDIAAYVHDFSVAEEKASSVRYIARLDYRFKPDEIRRLLRAYNVPFAETRSKPMVILPVYEVGATVVLWDEPNPWRDTFARRNAPIGLVPLILPLGDLMDISTAGAAEAMAGDIVKLDSIAARYRAAGAIVAHNNLTLDNTTGRQMETVTLLRPADPFPPESRTFSYLQNEGESIAALTVRVAEATVQRIENLWKQRNLISQGGTGVLAVTIPITGLADWLAMKDQLGRIGIIRRAEIVLMSREQVRVNVHFAGDAEQLMTALEQANLSLLQEAGEWVVMPIGVFQPPKT